MPTVPTSEPGGDTDGDKLPDGPLPPDALPVAPEAKPGDLVERAGFVVTGDIGGKLKDALAARKAVETAETIPLNQVVAMHVDDEQMIITFGKHSLESLGITYGATATNVDDGLARLEELAAAGTEVSLLMLDQVFPHAVDGQSIVQRSGTPGADFVAGLQSIKGRTEYAHALRNLRTVVVFTGTGGENYRAEIEAAFPGATVALVDKPASPNKIKHVALGALKASKTISDVEADEELAKLPPLPPKPATVDDYTG